MPTEPTPPETETDPKTQPHANRLETEVGQLRHQVKDAIRTNLIFRRITSSEAWGGYSELIKVLAPDEHEKGHVPEWGFLIARAAKLHARAVEVETERATERELIETAAIEHAKLTRITFEIGKAYKNIDGRMMHVLAEQGDQLVVTFAGKGPAYHATYGDAADWTEVDAG